MTQRLLFARNCLRTLVIAASILLLMDLTLAAQESTAPPSNPQSAIPAGRKAGTVAMITIHGPIDRITLHSLERRLDEAKARGADAVVLDIDTFGGDLQATIEILYLLRSKAPANTVAWIHPKAYSAGTIIALAMREIVVDSNGVFGDAAPIQGMPLTGLRQMAPAERAKIEAPLLSELVHEARRHGWDERLVQSFAAVDVSLWLIEHRSTGRQLFVDKDEYQEIFGEAPPLTRLKRLPPTPGRDPMSGLLPGADIDLDEPVPTSAERDIQIDEVQDLPSQRPDIESIDPAEWISLGQVVSEDELLVLKADEAEAYGLSSGKVDNETQLKSFFGANQIDRYDERWSEHLVRFLTWWPVRGVLIVIMLVGFFFEMASPGSGTFGAVALSALGILLLAPLMVGLAEWWTAIIVILGLLLVVLELFVIPGVGFIGILGGLLLFAGLVGTFLGPDPIGSTTREEVLRGIATTAAGFFGAGVIIWLLFRHVPNLPFSRKFVLADAVGGPASRNSPPPPAPHDPTEGIEVGSLGTAATDLRTSGRVSIGDRMIDARSVDGYISEGSKVRVTEVDSFGIQVEEHKE